ncbi:MAG TPA: UDP-N-acetylmuramate--L-alanine ligase [Candidatus Hypogeohydataceae bacterium YC38]
MNTSKKALCYHFVGLGGSGMSALAQLLLARGYGVSGSDRNLDRGISQSALGGFQKLSSLGITCLPQDGSGLDGDVDIVVVSSAIEEDNPDLKKAKEKGLPIVNRATLLAVLFNPQRGIAISGTNGKTTVTGMVSWVLDRAGLDPTALLGGIMKNYSHGPGTGNARIGRSDIMVIEADESDGSLTYYRPKIGVITGITLDHKPMGELLRLFSTFAENSQRLVLNANCPVLRSIKTTPKETLTYGFAKEAAVETSASGGQGYPESSSGPGALPPGLWARDVVCHPRGSSFRIEDACSERSESIDFELKLPGKHNVSNALAAAATCRLMSVPLGKVAEALRDFQGIRRRLDLIGETGGVQVVDDFAHNPQKIRSALEAVKLGSTRVLAVFQPHGFAPTRLMKEELIEAFSQTLSPNDILYMLEIFYAGGTVKRDISSVDLVADLVKRGLRAVYVPKRELLLESLREEARPGDTILVMGARDDTLTDFCHEILASLQNTTLQTSQ